MVEAEIEFKIGTKFYYGSRLVEVVENKKITKTKNGKCKYTFNCEDCFFHNRVIENPDWDTDYCEIVMCGNIKRRDKKEIIFKEIEE